MTDFSIDDAEKLLAGFDNAREGGMSYETGYDFASGLADDLAKALVHIRKLEAMKQAVEHAVELGYFAEGGSTEGMIRDALGTCVAENLK